MRAWLLWVVLVSCSWQGRVHAQPRELAASAQEDAAYRAAIATAIEEYDARNYAEAREQFRRAHALYPNARTLRGLGMAEFELRRYVASVGYFEAALDSQIKPLAGSLRSDTEATLARARAYVGRVELHVEPASARLWVDGAPRDHEASAPLLLVVGEHVLELRAPDRLAERRTITVEGNQQTLLQISLPEAKTADGAPFSHERAPDHEPRARRWWIWTSAAVVLAGGAIATAVILSQRANDGSDEDLTVLYPPPASTR